MMAYRASIVSGVRNLHLARDILELVVGVSVQRVQCARLHFVAKALGFAVLAHKRFTAVHTLDI